MPHAEREVYGPGSPAVALSGPRAGIRGTTMPRDAATEGVGFMRRTYPLTSAVALLAGLGLLGAAGGVSAPPEEKAPTTEKPAVTFAKDVLPFLKQHCFACHGNGKK